MLKSKAVLVVLLWTALCCGAAVRGNESQSAAARVAKVSAGINDFGFRLLRALARANRDNVIVSPLSVDLALAMTYNGAAGETSSAIAKTLALPPFNPGDFNRSNQELLGSLKKADNHSVQIEIANALWAQSGFTLNPAFIKLSQKFYDAAVASLDFAGSPQTAADTINAWVAKHTKGKIPTIIARPERNTRLILTDTVFFKGRWTSAFDKKETKGRSFHLLDGRSVETPMMTKTGDYPYFESHDFQAIQLAYGNSRFVMYVFLPRRAMGLSPFMRSLDERHWSQWSAGFEERRGKIVLPRFELTYGVQLNGALKDLGMDIAFDPDKADFSQIHPPPPSLFISDAEHKTYIKVDEEGTEAAAATSVTIAATMARSSPPPPFEMVVDHPFFCAIAESQSGALLFAGIVSDPTRH